MKMSVQLKSTREKELHVPQEKIKENEKSESSLNCNESKG